MKPRIAVIAPISQRERLLSALFLCELLPCLIRDYEVEVFTADEDLSEHLEVPVYHYLRLADRDSAKPFTAALAFLEDSPSLGFVRFSMVSIPLVLIAIDATVHRLFESQYWEFIDPAKVSLVDQVFTKPFAIGTLSIPALETVKGCLKREHIFGTSVPVRRKVNEKKTSDDFTIGFTGRYFIEDRVESILDVVLDANMKLQWIVSQDEEKPVRDFIELYFKRREKQVSEQVTVQIVKNFNEERDALAKCDTFVFLRADLLRSPPSALYQSLAIGLPVIVSDFISELSCAVVIPAGRGLEDALFKALNEIRSSDSLRQELSKRSLIYAETVHDPALVYEDLHQYLNLSGNELAKSIERKRLDFKKAEEELWA